jgi:hypothetical protein
MNTPIVDKMRHIRAMQAAMRGKVIYKNQQDEFVGGGKWEIVTTFKGKSHENGGIDLEVNDGYVRRISGTDEVDDIAGWGRFWKSVGATAYGIGEGLLDTVTMGATDEITDWGYKELQKAGGSSESERREQDSLRGYGTTAGAITGGIVTGGATTGSAIQQGGKGLGMGISKGSPDSKLAQQLGIWLPAAGAVGGMIAGNKGFAAGSGMSKLAKYAGYAGRGFRMVSPLLNAAQSMPTGGGARSAEVQQMGGMGGGAGGGAQAPLADGQTTSPAGMKGVPSYPPSEQVDMFYAQVPMREETLARLAQYNINV